MGGVAYNLQSMSAILQECTVKDFGTKNFPDVAIHMHVIYVYDDNQARIQNT